MTRRQPVWLTVTFTKSASFDLQLNKKMFICQLCNNEQLGECCRAIQTAQEINYTALSTMLFLHGRAVLIKMSSARFIFYDVSVELYTLDLFCPENCR